LVLAGYSRLLAKAERPTAVGLLHFPESSLMRKTIAAGLLAALVFVVGCGGSGEKGKNKDKDVPKPAKVETTG
jgi:hypothetical protein